MLRMITGYWVSQAVGVAARLGVADQLTSGPRSSADLARAVGAQPQALHRVLRMLASIGVFSQPDPGVFALTPLGETLRSDTPGSLRFFAIAETAFGHWAPWGRLLDSVKTGAPMARETLGGELWEWYGQNAEEAEFFSAAMGNLSALAASELMRVYDCTTARTIADVGGAHGVLLAAALRANPNARGILFDLPHVIATAADSLEGQGVADRSAHPRRIARWGGTEARAQSWAGVTSRVSSSGLSTRYQPARPSSGLSDPGSRRIALR